MTNWLSFYNMDNAEFILGQRTKNIFPSNWYHWRLCRLVWSQRVIKIYRCIICVHRHGLITTWF